MTNLMLDEKALETMGLSANAIYTVEYDFISPLKIPQGIGQDKKKEMTLRNTKAREFRNRLEFILKFHLNATRHLESSWIIDGEHLETANDKLEELKESMKASGFHDADERIRIIPILTTIEGFEHYEDKKAEFLLAFAMEHIRYLEKGLKAKKLSKSTLWRCKKTSEIINTLKEELKDNPHFNEIVDTVTILDDNIGQMENIEAKQKKKTENN